MYKRQELKTYGLDVPQATELAFELKEAGMPLSDGILSREELVKAVSYTHLDVYKRQTYCSVWVLDVPVKRLDRSLITSTF